MKLLHEGHLGTTRMKGFARSIVWWPSDIVDKVKQCRFCQVNQKMPPPAPLHPWEWPKRPWARLHIDHAGPFQGKLFLVVVDAHSKWLEASIVPSVSSQATIKVLRKLFATHGLPEAIVSDNATGFCSEEFREFVEQRSETHHRCSLSPCNQWSGGEGSADRQGRTEKKMNSGDL